MKKFLALTLVAALAATVATGCGKSDGNNASGAGGDSGEKVELVWLSQGVGEDSWEGITAPILDKYNENGKVTVKGEFYSFNDLFDVIEVKIASGSKDYDVISVDSPMVASYANRGMLAPLDEYFSDEEKAEFAEAGLEAGIWDGKLYAPPENTSTQVLWYNTALLEEAGITVPENDTTNRLTWEQVAEMATQAKQKLDPDGTQGIYGIEWQQVSRVYQMNALPNSMGGLNIGEDGFTVEGVINDDAWVKACTWYQDLVNAKVAPQGITADETGDYFYSGKIVFYQGGTWTASNCDAKGMTTYAFCPSPAFEGYEDKVATATGSWQFGVNAASTHIDESAEFVKWFTLGEGNDMWLEANGDVPSRIEKLDEIINDPDAPGYLKIGAEEAKTTAFPRALTPGFNEYQTILGNAWEDIRNGSDVKTSLDSAAKQITDSMAQYK